MQGWEGFVAEITLSLLCYQPIAGPRGGGQGTLAGDGGGQGRGQAGRSWSVHPCPTPSPHNTLFLELWCPAVAPAIVVTSDKGKTISNFGDIAVGES